METFRYLWVALAVLFVGVRADCASYGVDYSNGGSYYIDGSSNQYFSFITIFQGCNQESIQPVLVGPDDNEYACSAVNTSPAGAQVTSTCGIPFSAMRSGTWRIIVSGNQLAVQRTITLTVGIPQTVVVTATPTIIIGITSTPRAQTVMNTVSQTQTLILVPQTVTAGCSGATRTVTNYPQGPTVTVTSTVVRASTEGQLTSYYATTLVTTAVCHYPSNKRDVAATGVVAAVTTTYTQTTYTVTQTLVTTVPARTTTELVYKTVTATVTPAASTICANGNNPGVTVTVNRGSPTTTTQTNIIYQTTRASGTVWVGQTSYSTVSNAASATACWRAGGWFGL